jgi:hypothetical protein
MLMVALSFPEQQVGRYKEDDDAKKIALDRKVAEKVKETEIGMLEPMIQLGGDGCRYEYGEEDFVGDQKSSFTHTAIVP